jgi:hypothetical protein
MPPGSRWGLILSGLHKALIDFVRRHRERWALADERERQARWDEEQTRRRRSLEQ